MNKLFSRFMLLVLNQSESIRVSVKKAAKRSRFYSSLPRNTNIFGS
jgi:hypothetical protein